MNRLAVAAGAVSLAQGFPDFPCPPELKEAAAAAVHDDINQYAITWGAKPLRDAIATSTAASLPGLGGDRSGDPGHGHLRRDRGDDRGDARAARPGRRGRRVRAVLRELRAGRDPGRRRPALRDAPRAGLVDRPGRAAGGVRAADARRSSSTRRTTRPARSSRRDELELIAELCLEFDAIAFTDDIYEHIVFEGEHIPLATLPGMAERTVSIHSMSKSYSVTGWRIGWTIAPPDLSRRDPARPRLPDGRGGGAAAGRGGRRPRVPGPLLRGPRGRLSRATRRAPAGAADGRLPGPRAGRRLLRDDRHPRPDRRGRRRRSRCA